jgi:hypothetical protein
MHEHGSEECQKITEGIGEEAARNESPFLNKSVTATQLYKEKQNVQSEQAYVTSGIVLREVLSSPIGSIRFISFYSGWVCHSFTSI